ncbi:hypothetical protein IG631_13046 [Alternaria alternata]|nr:hypothetical protein IG631_13046 [Alternaria alternata]
MTSKVITTRIRNVRNDVATKPFDEIIAEVEDGISHLTMFGQDDLKPAPKRSRKAQRVVIIQAGLRYSARKLVLISRTPKIIVQFGNVFNYPIARMGDFGCAMPQLETETIAHENYHCSSSHRLRLWTLYTPSLPLKSGLACLIPLLRRSERCSVTSATLCLHQDRTTTEPRMHCLIRHHPSQGCSIATGVFRHCCDVRSGDLEKQNVQNRDIRWAFEEGIVRATAIVFRSEHARIPPREAAGAT